MVVSIQQRGLGSEAVRACLDELEGLSGPDSIDSKWFDEGLHLLATSEGVGSPLGPRLLGGRAGPRCSEVRRDGGVSHRYLTIVSKEGDIDARGGIGALPVWSSGRRNSTSAGLLTGKRAALVGR